jgi:hypothetical protein
MRTRSRASNKSTAKATHVPEPAYTVVSSDDDMEKRTATVRLPCLRERRGKGNEPIIAVPTKRTTTSTTPKKTKKDDVNHRYQEKIDASGDSDATEV